MRDFVVHGASLGVANLQPTHPNRMMIERITKARQLWIPGMVTPNDDDSSDLTCWIINGCTIPYAVNENTVFPRGARIINPPPMDGRCERCMRHMSAIPPYGPPGDPLIGDFSDMKLVKFHFTEVAEWCCRACARRLLEKPATRLSQSSVRVDRVK